MQPQGNRRFRGALLFIVFASCLALAPPAAAVALPSNFREDVNVFGPADA